MIYTIFIFSMLLVIYSSIKRLPSLFVFSTFLVMYLSLRPILLSIGVYSKYSYVNDLFVIPHFDSINDLAILIFLNILAFLVFYFFVVNSRFIFVSNKIYKGSVYYYLYYAVLLFLFYFLDIPFYIVFSISALVFCFLLLNKKYLSALVSLAFLVGLVSLSEDRRDWLMVIYIGVILYAFVNEKVSMLKLFFFGVVGFFAVIYISISLRTNGILDYQGVMSRLQNWPSIVSVVEVETDFSIVYDDLLVMYHEVDKSNIDYLYGFTLLKPFFSIVPRELWPNKPETVSRIYSKVVNPDFYQRGGSQPLTFIGESFWNLGWFSFIFSFFLGGYFGIIDSNYLTAKKNRNFFLMGLSIVLASSSFHILRGPYDSFWLIHFFVYCNFLIYTLVSNKYRF